MYHSNGQVMKERFVESQKDDVIEKQYYPSGALQTEVFDLEGKNEGFGNKVYYENGTIKSTAYYYLPQVKSIIKNYDESGRLIEEIDYEQGREVRHEKTNE